MKMFNNFSAAVVVRAASSGDDQGAMCASNYSISTSIHMLFFSMQTEQF